MKHQRWLRDAETVMRLAWCPCVMGIVTPGHGACPSGAPKCAPCMARFLVRERGDGESLSRPATVEGNHKLETNSDRCTCSDGDEMCEVHNL